MSRIAYLLCLFLNKKNTIQKHTTCLRRLDVGKGRTSTTRLQPQRREATKKYTNNILHTLSLSFFFSIREYGFFADSRYKYY